MFEGHFRRRVHSVYCFKTVMFIFHMSDKVITSADLQFTDAGGDDERMMVEEENVGRRRKREGGERRKETEEG